jgi:hypothetical protein
MGLINVWPTLMLSKWAENKTIKINAEKTSMFVSQKNTGQNHNTNLANECFENVAVSQFRNNADKSKLCA